MPGLGQARASSLHGSMYHIIYPLKSLANICSDCLPVRVYIHPRRLPQTHPPVCVYKRPPESQAHTFSCEYIRHTRLECMYLCSRHSLLLSLSHTHTPLVQTLGPVARASEDQAGRLPLGRGVWRPGRGCGGITREAAAGRAGSKLCRGMNQEDKDSSEQGHGHQTCSVPCLPSPEC